MVTRVSHYQLPSEEADGPFRTALLSFAEMSKRVSQLDFFEISKGNNGTYTTLVHYPSNELLAVHSKEHHSELFAAAVTAQQVVVGHTDYETMVTPTTSLRTDGVLVFCGSREGRHPEYAAAGQKLGELIGQSGRNLVYGGGTVGIMGAVARGCHNVGGGVIGVIPRALKPKEVAGDMIGTVFFTDTMSTRKSIMFAHSSTVIALPGGIGTFDELLEVLTLFQLNAYRPAIGLLNVRGFFDPFQGMLKQMVEEGFLNADAMGYFVVSSDPVDLMDRLAKFQPPGSVKELKWTAAP